jgi:hypothetical protein
MRFVLETGEELTRDEGATALSFLENVLIGLGFTITESEFSEIDVEENKIGDHVITQEHFFESKITRVKDLAKKKKVKDVCMESVGT